MKENNTSFKQQIERREQIRNRLIIIFILLIFIPLSFPLIFNTDENTFVPIFVIITILNSVILISIAVYPYFRPIEYQFNPDAEINVLEGDMVESEYYELLPMKLVRYLVTPFGLIFFLMFIHSAISNKNSETLIYAISSLFFVLVYFYLSKIEIFNTKSSLVVKMGPFGDKFGFKNIQSVELTTIRWFRQYLGIGKRIGSDGSIAYVSGIKSGIRLKMKNKKTYVLSSEQPEKLLSYIRSHQMNVQKTD